MTRTPLLSAAVFLVVAVLCLGVGLLIDPLRPIRGAAHVVAAQGHFTEDLAAYRAHPVPFDALPVLRGGLCAYEDRGYDDRPRFAPPVSPTGLGRALLRNLRGVREGGSTIPMQVAKLYLRDGAGTVRDKAEEVLFATWLVRQASPDEVLGLYLDGSSARMLAGSTASTGADRLAMAMFGIPLGQLPREEQLLLAAAPRGLAWLRQSDRSGARLLAARDWLVTRGVWDPAAPSYFADGDVDAAAAWALLPGWRENLATWEASSTDRDLVEAVPKLREELAKELSRTYPGTTVRMAFTVVGAGGRVLVRSGAESAAMRINYGSIAKIEPLAAAVDLLGVEAVRTFVAPREPCVRWFWTPAARPEAKPSQWCPADAGAVPIPVTMDEAVALSNNTATGRHVMLLPFRATLAGSPEVARIQALAERAPAVGVDTDADRAVSASVLTSLGVPTLPDAVPRALSYTRLETGWYRWLNERRAAAGLPTRGLPEDPTQTSGNSSSATLEQVAAYVHAKLFAPDAGCTLSDTGALLAGRRREGTLRWLAQRYPKLVFAGKTGTSSMDDAALATVGVCLDGRAVVIAAALRPINGKLPDGLHGALTLRGIAGWIDVLAKLERRVESPALPTWALAPEGAALVDTAPRSP